MKATLEYPLPAEQPEHRRAVYADELHAFLVAVNEYRLRLRITGPEPPDAHHAKQLVARDLEAFVKPVEHLI